MRMQFPPVDIGQYDEGSQCYQPDLTRQVRVAAVGISATWIRSGLLPY